mmetsp:Transcript_80371/g.230670  ORF Transcript_80371/g.230670 Transcript_80371/m.230670 type:complete len:85 (+) Transcript_80371:70-324(+)
MVEEAPTVGLGEERLNLLAQWWFYVLLFFAIYAFAVAVHLYFDYKHWQRERDRLDAAEGIAASPAASSSDGAPPAANPAEKKSQ